MYEPRSALRTGNGHHQFGSNEWGRLQADNAFLAAMLKRCSATYTWYDARLRVCATSALTYYNAVRIVGVAFYYDYNTRF